MGNWFSSLNFQKDFDDVIIGLEIDKKNLTKDNFTD